MALAKPAEQKVAAAVVGPKNPRVADAAKALLGVIAQKKAVSKEVAKEKAAQLKADKASKLKAEKDAALPTKAAKEPRAHYKHKGDAAACYDKHDKRMKTFKYATCGGSGNMV